MTCQVFLSCPGQECVLVGLDGGFFLVFFSQEDPLQQTTQLLRAQPLLGWPGAQSIHRSLMVCLV